MRWLTFLLVAAMLAGCKAPAAAVARRPAAATPTPSPAAMPVASAGPVAPAATPPAAAVTLRPPGGASATLAGTIAIDARYALAHGGRLVSNNGASAVVVGGNVISDHGGGVVSNNGGAIVSNNAGTIVANNAGNVIPPEASGVVATRGGAARATDAGTIVAAGIAPGAAARHLLADEPASPAVAADTELPGIGMLVSAVSLETHQYLPLGIDDRGRPVYAVYSDAKGGYKLFLPAGTAGNVLVVASMPDAADERAHYDAVSAAGATDAGVMDDDTALATRAVRRVLVRQVATLLTAPDAATTIDAITGGNSLLPPAFQGALVQLVKQVHDHARAKNLPTGAAATDVPEVQELARLMTDVALGYMSYDQLQTSALTAPMWKGPSESVFVGLGGMLRALRVATAAALQRRLDAGASLPIRFTIRHGLYTNGSQDMPACAFDDPVPVQRPADLGTYFIDDVLSREIYGDFGQLRGIFHAVSAVPTDPKLDQAQPGYPEYYEDPATHQALDQCHRAEACLDTILSVFALTLVPLDAHDGDPPSPALAAALQAMDTYTAAHAFTDPPRPRPRLGEGTPCTPPPAATP